jgi:hypothetical protein
MRLLSPTKTDLERWLLRRGVGALVADRSRCASCRRTPLVGEEVYFYESGRDSGRMLCALCRSQRRETPVACERVRSPEWAHAVRPAAAA